MLSFDTRPGARASVAGADRVALTEGPGAEPDVAEPTGPARPSRWRARLGLLVSALALAAVVWWISRQERPALPSSAAALSVLGLALALQATTMLMRGLRWHVILRRAGIRHRTSDAYGLVAVGYMGNVVLPARGGEVLRVMLLHGRSDGGRRQILGTIVAERLLDVIGLVTLLAVITLAGTAGTPAGVVPALAGLAALLAGALALATYLHLRRAGRFETFAAKVRPVAAAAKPLLSRRGLELAGLSVAIWLLDGLVFALVARSVDVELSILEGAFLVVIANFFALVPAAPGYVGTYDAAVLFGLNALDVTGSLASGVAILARFIAFVPITLAGLVLLMVRYGGLGVIRRR